MRKPDNDYTDWKSDYTDEKRDMWDQVMWRVD
jgi:hypothetical protein